MIIVRMSGGLGNQLFQYATALQIAQNNSFLLLLDTSSFTSKSIRYFCLNQLIPSVSIIPKEYIKTLIEPHNVILKKISEILKLERLPKIIESKKGFDSQIANINFPCYLKGSFISFKYFDSINNEFLDSLFFSDKLIKDAENSMVSFLGFNLVCVSVRRGDFLDYESLNVCGKEFYIRSITEARNLLVNPVFLFFSDDINWVRENFVSEDFQFWDVKNYNLIMKLYAMTMCNHFIISNSSYSWWGAWLSKNPLKHVFCSSVVENDYSFPVSDYYPDSWIKIKPY